jgi:hypothetical protein
MTSDEKNVVEFVKCFAADMFECEPELMATCELAEAGNTEALAEVVGFYNAMNESK